MYDHHRISSHFPLYRKCRVELEVLRDFRLLVVFMYQFPPSPWESLGSCRIFSKIRADIRSSRCTTGVVDTGGKWKKSSIIKVLIILFVHLWEVELTYRCIFAFKFTLRSRQPDSVPIICHRCRWYRWCTLTCEYLRELKKKFETVLMGYSGADSLIHEKTRSKKISWHSPFKVRSSACHTKRRKIRERKDLVAIWLR